jgi:ribosomal protein L19E
LSAARSKGRHYRKLIDEGTDPRDHEREQAELRAREQEQARLAAKRAECGILSRAVDDFLAQCRKAGQRRWKERERQLRRYLPAEWQYKHLDEISRDDCRALLEHMEAENGHVQGQSRNAGGAPSTTRQLAKGDANTTRHPGCGAQRGKPRVIVS